MFEIFQNRNPSPRSRHKKLVPATSCVLAFALMLPSAVPDVFAAEGGKKPRKPKFNITEATIGDIHKAIKKSSPPQSWFISMSTALRRTTEYVSINQKGSWDPFRQSLMPERLMR